MPISLPKRPNVRHCTHIKVTGQQCGSPALRGEFFCYFHTRVIKGVQQRVDMQLHSMALLEDCESIQLSIMYVVDGLIKGTLEPVRARLIIQALRIAARNAKNVRFDEVHYRASEQPMVREVPDYAQQYLIEHPEFGPPLDTCGAGAPAREPGTGPCGADAFARHAEPSQCAADTTVREAAKNAVVQLEAQAEPQPTKQSASQESVAADPAAKRRQNAAHGASRGIEAKNNPAPKERKNPRHEPVDHDDPKEYERIQQAQAAIPGALAGNWRDLRTVFEFAGICEQDK
jgi:hypothetical protein